MFFVESKVWEDLSVKKQMWLPGQKPHEKVLDKKTKIQSWKKLESVLKKKTKANFQIEIYTSVLIF